MSRIGEKWATNDGCIVEIVEYYSNKNCTVKFENGFVIQNVQYSRIKKGNIKNLYHPSVYGKGYLGEGDYKSSFGSKDTLVYKRWHGMMERCYDKSYLKRNPTYSDCSVSEEWHNFQIFAKWFEENYSEGFVLDKDILIKRNKVYSSTTCCFIPHEINSLVLKCDSKRGDYPIGVEKVGFKFKASLHKNGKLIYLGLFNTPKKAFKAYKKAKEKEIKEVAKLCKGIIPSTVYKVLMNYKVEIND